MVSKSGGDALRPVTAMRTGMNRALGLTSFASQKPRIVVSRVSVLQVRSPSSSSARASKAFIISSTVIFLPMRSWES